MTVKRGDPVLLAVAIPVIALALINAFVILHQIPDETVYTWSTPIVVVGGAILAGLWLWDQPTNRVAWTVLVAAAAVVTVAGVAHAPNSADPTVWIVWAALTGLPIICYALVLRDPKRYTP